MTCKKRGRPPKELDCNYIYPEDIEPEDIEENPELMALLPESVRDSVNEDRMELSYLSENPYAYFYSKGVGK